MNFHIDIEATNTEEHSAKICPANLSGIFERFPSIKLLSLDCFDTLVWRHAYRPFDVFHAVAKRPAFQKAGITATSRRTAERTARTLRRLHCGQREIELVDVYRAAVPSLSAQELEELAEEELAAECELAFAHPSAVALLRCAGDRGIPVTIVSDTYFDPVRLRRLLEHVLPPDACRAITRIVCSSEFGISKAEGLFELAYPEDEIPRESILHIGDNESADYLAATQAGIAAIHLVQLPADTAGREMMKGAILPVLVPALRYSAPMQTPYRGPLSAWRSGTEEDPTQFGAEVLGPVFHAFGRWLAHERQQLLDEDRNTKFVFLLRDGHLPFLAHRELNGPDGCFRAAISRFTAFAASFRSLADIDQYLARFVSTRRFEALARQLLLPADIATKIAVRAEAAADPVASFCESVRRPRVVEEILRASARFRERMQRYLEREIGLKTGDSVVFVDVGYVGTTQRVLQPVFEEEWGVRLAGRYLLFTGVSTDRSRGMLDASFCDLRALDAMIPYLSVIDNLCPCPGGSIEDYAEDGAPIFGAQLLEPEQTEHVTRLQSDCIRFVRHAETFFDSCRHPVELDALRESALGELGRLIFFPSRSELALLEDFQGEVNLGTTDRRQLFDRHAGLDGLRQRGLNFIERNAAARPHYPAELRSAGLELSTTLLLQQRYSLEIPFVDWSYRSEEIEMLIVRDEESLRETIPAFATHDGFFAATVPIGDGSFHLGLLLGKRYCWMQMHSAGIIPVSKLMSNVESRYCRDALPALILDGIDDHGQGLWECQENALVMIPAGLLPATGEPAVCRLVFRPIAHRQPERGGADV